MLQDFLFNELRTPVKAGIGKVEGNNSYKQTNLFGPTFIKRDSDQI